MQFLLTVCTKFYKIDLAFEQETEKGKPLHFILIEEELKAKGVLKNKLIPLPLLTLPRSDELYTNDTGAYDPQVGCSLLQEQEKRV